jgi:SAM-dependent methyltransferase
MRLEALERMDTEALSPQDASSILTDLERINRWIGGVAATLSHFDQFARRWRAGERIRILDWGTGGADVPRAIVRWALRHGHRVEITGIDSNAAVLAVARERCKDYPEIRLIEADARSWPDPPHPFDYVISSLTLHHLDDKAIVELLRRSDRLARRGMVMNDLIRSARAWAWIWGLSRLVRMHPIVQADGPLSIRRAFAPRELASYARQAGVSYVTVRKHFGYRLTLAGEKS